MGGSFVVYDMVDQFYKQYLLFVSGFPLGLEKRETLENGRAFSSPVRKY